MKKSELRKIIKEELGKTLKEGFATHEGRNLDRISGWLGYDGFHEFIGDNPGCYEEIISWIDRYFSEEFKREFINPDELDKVGLTHSADEIRGNL